MWKENFNAWIIPLHLLLQFSINKLDFIQYFRTSLLTNCISSFGIHFLFDEQCMHINGKMLGNRSTCSISVMPRRTNKDIQFYDFVMRGFSFPQASPTAIVWISLFTSHLFFGIFIWTLWILRKYSMIITGRIFASLQTMQCINLKTSQLFNVQLLSHVMSPLRNVLCLHLFSFAFF